MDTSNDQRRSVYVTRRGNGTARRGSLSCVTRGFCVTGSVAVGTPRDGQDTTGRDSILDLYLAQRADFTKEFANSADGPIRFSRPRMTLVRKTSAFRSPAHCSTWPGGHAG